MSDTVLVFRLSRSPLSRLNAWADPGEREPIPSIACDLAPEGSRTEWGVAISAILR